MCVFTGISIINFMIWGTCISIDLIERSKKGRLPVHLCVCFLVLLWLSASLVMFFLLRTDGRLLALCDHGNWPCLMDQYGQRGYWVERPGWFLM